jgi:hypothetical protein
MDDQDYSELRIRLMAHQTLLCAVIASHPDKVGFSAAMSYMSDAMQSQLLASRLDDKTLAVFDEEIRSILEKAGMAIEGKSSPK